MSRARAWRHRAARWAEAEDRVGAVIVVGSVAAGTETVFSDLDLVIVARDGRRESLWDDREHIAEAVLGGRVGWSQDLPWQGRFRYQAWPEDLAAMVDLTIDEGQPSLSRALRAGFECLVDRDGVEERLRIELEEWEPPGPDVASIDDSVWPWLAYLDQRVKRGQLWTVRAELHEILHRRVVPLLITTQDPHEGDLSEQDLAALHDAAPRSGEAAELRRALLATLDVYQLACERSASRAGRRRLQHPLSPVVIDRLRQ